MSEARTQKSSATTGTLSITAAALLYALSIGPAACLVFNDIVSGPPGDRLVEFYSPVLWLRDHTPLKESISAYLGWWDDLARRP